MNECGTNTFQHPYRRYPLKCHRGCLGVPPRPGERSGGVVNAARSANMRERIAGRVEQSWLFAHRCTGPEVVNR